MLPPLHNMTIGNAANATQAKIIVHIHSFLIKKPPTTNGGGQLIFISQLGSAQAQASTAVERINLWRKYPRLWFP
jgi:hypothetical protein